MNCQVPHNQWRTFNHKTSGFKDRPARNEDQFNFDGNVMCPRISFLEDGLLHNNTAESWPVMVDLDEHVSLPTPVTQPNPCVTCGRGPVPQSVSKKKELDHFLFKETLAHECRLLIRNSHGTINLGTIKNDWKKYMKRNELPENEHGLIRIMDRFVCDEPPVESYAGGNLAIVLLQDERYIIHSAMEPFDCQLCLTRMTADDIMYHPMRPMRTKTPLSDGVVYQIATPRQSSSWDSSLVDENDPIFVTRQMHTTRLWKIDQNETGSQPVFTNIQEYSNPSSAVRYVELNQFEWGEFCELRPQGVKISKEGLLKNEKTFDKKYDSCMYWSPKILVLSSSRTLDLLDFRCRNTENLNSIFSIENQELRTYFNIPHLERIVSFSASSRDNVYLVSTEKSLLVWDIRCGNRPLCRTAHLLERPPDWISTVASSSEKDWIFLDSQDPAYSTMVGLSWNNQDNCQDGMDELPIVSVEIEPRVRWNVFDNFEVIQQRGLGLGWSIQNRFKQMRSGIACDKDVDGTIQIWQCTVAGDIFSQQLNPSKRIGPSQQKTSDTFFKQMNDWIEVVEQIEELDASVSQWHYNQNEESDAEILIDDVRETVEELEEENFGSFHISGIFNHPAPTEKTDCKEDRTKKKTGRSESINKYWANENVPGPPQSFLQDDSFSIDFDNDLISSTPFQPNMSREKVVPLPGFLASSTPAISRIASSAIRAVRPNFVPPSKHQISSTLFRQQTQKTWNTPPQRKMAKKSQDWDF